MFAAAAVCISMEIAWCQHVPFAALPEEEVARLYQQARVTPGARQIGLSCAFFANVPVLTMAGGINIADGSVEAREFAASIYGLRRGDFTFMSAFDRGMFFDLFGIPSKPVTIYHREASRGELLSDAEEIVRRDLVAALDQGQFASLRVLGEFGGPHNVLLLACRGDTFFYHDPRTGRITASPAAEMASKILSVSKSRSTTKKRYFSSYHLVSIPAPLRVNPKPLTLRDLAPKLEIEPSATQMEFITLKLSPTGEAKDASGSFPQIHFVTPGSGRSAIRKDLPVTGLNGIFNLSKLALNSHKSGARGILPVWILEGGPLVMIGYGQGDGRGLVFSDGKRKFSLGMDEALRQFKERGCFFGYVRVSGG
jgi:hypothetical protein